MVFPLNRNDPPVRLYSRGLWLAKCLQCVELRESWNYRSTRLLWYFQSYRNNLWKRCFRSVLKRSVERNRVKLGSVREIRPGCDIPPNTETWFEGTGGNFCVSKVSFFERTKHPWPNLLLLLRSPSFTVRGWPVYGADDCSALWT